MVQDWTRRGALAGMAAVTATAAEARARFAVPDGACDCHHHIYDPRFAYQPNAMLKPAPATVADYRKVQRKLGTSRDIVVTPSTYGTDNRVTVDALGQLGKNARGVAVIHADLPDAELKRLDDAGIRGVRIQFGRGKIVEAPEIMPLAMRIHSLGWHIQFNMTGSEIVGLKETLLRLPVPIVFDHLAHIPMPEGTKSDTYKLVRRLLDSGRAWVKLSSPYTDSKIGPPNYPDTGAIAHDYVIHAPERTLWASNWPFPDVPSGKPDPLAMLNLLQQWAPDPAARHRVLVENPEALYGFDPADRPKALRG